MLSLLEKANIKKGIPKNAELPNTDKISILGKNIAFPIKTKLKIKR